MAKIAAGLSSVSDMNSFVRLSALTQFFAGFQGYVSVNILKSILVVTQLAQDNLWALEQYDYLNYDTRGFFFDHDM